MFGEEDAPLGPEDMFFGSEDNCFRPLDVISVPEITISALRGDYVKKMRF